MKKELEEEYRNMSKKELQEQLMKMPELEITGIPNGDTMSDTDDEEELANTYRNMTRQELEEQLMEMPELETQEDELIHKRMNDINTFQAHENEVYLRGTDEYGKDFQICFDSYNFLEWIDTEHLKYIKKQLIKHIRTR